MKKPFILAVFLICALFLCPEAIGAEDVTRDMKVKRLYYQAEDLVEAGSYDKAIKKYNEAIKLSRDKDITRFIKNAKDEAKIKKIEERKRLKKLAKEKKLAERKKRIEADKGKTVWQRLKEMIAGKGRNK